MATTISGSNFSGFLDIVDLVGIKFNDFAITCSIHSKMCNTLILVDTICSENGAIR